MRLLFVDDEQGFTDLVLAELPREWNKYAAYTLASARRILSRNIIDVVVLDLKLPDGSGLSLLEDINKLEENAPEVFILTGHGSVNEAVIAMRQGAYDFVTKPVAIDELESVIRAGGRRKGIGAPMSRDMMTAIDKEMPPGLRPHAMQALELSESRLPFLIHGERGVGKRTFAKLVHKAAGHSDSTLRVLDAEHETTDWMLQATESGVGVPKTLILHEVGKLNERSQGVLLTVLSPDALMTQSKPEWRVICTTTNQLHMLVETERFREDLFFNLSVFTITIPPLRERLDDLAWFVEHFADREIAPPAMDAMRKHPWQGNVDELLFVLRIACDAAGSAPTVRKPHIETGIELAGDYFRPALTGPLTLNEVESTHIQRVLRFTAGNQSQAAKLLGIDPKTLYRKLRSRE